ncbi:MAG: hypothetical protein OXH93_12155, partial [Caldilineaceae bacterium]|nr:hypothetical protein [Caldilineaceae bacterium]
IEGLGFLGLVWADTAKQGAHAVVMLGLLYWKLGNVATGWRPDSAREKSEGRGKSGIGPTVRSFGSVIGAAGAMVVVIAWLLSLLDPGGETSLSNDVLRIVVCGGGGVLTYAGFLLLVGQPEARQLGRAALRIRGLVRVK